jgi:uncharacterized protein (TIGR02001 family)
VNGSRRAARRREAAGGTSAVQALGRRALIWCPAAIPDAFAARARAVPGAIGAWHASCKSSAELQHFHLDGALPMKKNSLFLLPVLALAFTCAQAQTAAPAAAAASAPEPTLMSTITGNINVTSNYKFRGQDQGTLKGWSPAVQGGFDWTQNGFYLGNWDSNISFAGNIEMDFYGGYRGEIVKDLGYDVGILQYYYPKNGGQVNFNTTELYGLLSWQWLSLKYSTTISSDYFGIGQAQQLAASSNGTSISSKGRNTGYLDLSANYPVVDKLVLNAHLGYTRFASDLRNASYSYYSGDGACDPCAATGVPNYTDWKVGLTYDLGSGFSVAGAVVGASKKSFYGDANSTRAIVTFSKSM